MTLERFDTAVPQATAAGPASDPASGHQPGTASTTSAEADRTEPTLDDRFESRTERSARRFARSMAKEAKRAVKNRARRVASRLTEELASTADQQRAKAADRVRALSHAATCAADSLSERREALQMPVAGAAGGIERVASYLEATDLAEIRRDVEGFARRSPRLFAGSALLVGVAVGRFLRAQPPRRPADPARDSASRDSASFDPPKSSVPPLQL